jgi:hypothetical protein
MPQLLALFTGNGNNSDNEPEVISSRHSVIPVSRLSKISSYFAPELTVLIPVFKISNCVAILGSGEKANYVITHKPAVATGANTVWVEDTLVTPAPYCVGVYIK